MLRKYEVIVIKVADGIELHYFPRWLEEPDRWMQEFEKLSFTPEIPMDSKNQVSGKRISLTYRHF